jgi:predicted RNA-binding protein (TIGR00451 family)
MPKLQVDEGGIKFVLKGADIFCAGITSKGGKIFEPLDKDVPVQIMGEGKDMPFAIGITAMSTEEMQQTGVGVTMMHSLNDDLWRVKDWRM